MDVEENGERKHLTTALASEHQDGQWKTGTERSRQGTERRARGASGNLDEVGAEEVGEVGEEEVGEEDNHELIRALGLCLFWVFDPLLTMDATTAVKIWRANLSLPPRQ